MNWKRDLLGITFTILLTTAAEAELRVAPVFSHNMVLQQGVPVAVWGWADEGDAVTVRFRNQKVTAKTANLKWEVRLAPLKSGGPDTFAVETRRDSLQFTNVLVGEVWVCSGQSNMEWPMNKAFEPAGDIASATNPVIRLFKVPKNRQDTPTVLINSAWETLSPASVEGFSAVGYYFGRELAKARKVPIGLIGTYWGGTPAEAWTARETLEVNPRYRSQILEPYQANWKKWRLAQADWEKEKAAVEKEGKKFEKRAPQPPWYGSELFNGMINPLLPFPAKGAIWYQGESNASRAEQYRGLFADMIRSWRSAWGQPEMPFLAVQLAPFRPRKADPADSDWAELREAQLLAVQTLPNVGMAVITDVGEENDIHPTRKQPVGTRLALAARAIAYGEKIPYSGPVYKSMEIKGGEAALSFDHADSGLEARGGELTGFAIAGADRKFVWAKARIEGRRVIVNSPEVAAPVAVRYGWADFPVVNLWNKAGLPATPFRTDDFPLITAGK
jgi:sialate O-acetylesterase